MELKELLAYWDSNEGKPYKGKLIDWERYGGDGKEPPTDLGCACAQGQVLIALGGWEPDRLKIEQAEADLAVAELLNISISHAIVLRHVNDSIDGAPSVVLTEPEKVLGANAKGILSFWLHLDKMSETDWRDARAARDAWDARDARAARAAWDARDAWDAWAARAAWDARDAKDAWDAWDARDARDAWDAWDARDAWDAWDARDIAYAAVAEIAGAKWLDEHKEGKFVFLPMFGFADPSAVPALPANYGIPS